MTLRLKSTSSELSALPAFVGISANKEALTGILLQARGHGLCLLTSRSTELDEFTLVHQLDVFRQALDISVVDLVALVSSATATHCQRERSRCPYHRLCHVKSSDPVSARDNNSSLRRRLDGSIKGIATGDMGIAEVGSEKETFQAG